MTSGLRLVVLIAIAIALDVALLVLPPGRAILDARLHYRADDVLALLIALGPAGRAAYVRHELVDVAFIATYSLLGHTLAQRLAAPSLRITVLVVALADLIETIGIIVLLRTFPSPSPALAASLGWFTSAKWLALLAAVAIGMRARLRRTKP